MAIIVKIKQKGFFKKNLSLVDIKKIGRDKYEYGTRDNNSSYVFQEFDSQNVAKENSSIVLKNKSNFGRGFIVFVDKKNLGVTLNAPTTNSDITDYYEFIENACQYLNASEFTQDETVVKLNDIDQEIAKVIDFNYNNLKSFLIDHTEIIIYGAENPLYIPEAFRQHLATLSGSKLDEVFSEYLRERQSLDLYYMKPNFYKKEDKIMAVYTLTETVDYIVPKKAFIPYTATQYLNDSEPNDWILSIVFLNQKKEIKHIDFSHLEDYLSQMNLDEYDDKHWILKGVNADFIDKLLSE